MLAHEDVFVFFFKYVRTNLTYLIFYSSSFKLSSEVITDNHTLHKIILDEFIEFLVLFLYFNLFVHL